MRELVKWLLLEMRRCGPQRKLLLVACALGMCCRFAFASGSPPFPGMVINHHAANLAGVPAAMADGRLCYEEDNGYLWIGTTGGTNAVIWANPIGGLLASNNLSDVGNKTTSLSNLWSGITTAQGDMISMSVSSTVTRIYANTSTTREFLSGTGTGVIGQNPAWSTLAITDIPTGTTSSTVTIGNDSRVTGALQKSVVTAVGDILYATGSGTITNLAGNSTTTPYVYTSTGTGSAANAPTLTATGTSSGNIAAYNSGNRLVTANPASTTDADNFESRVQPAIVPLSVASNLIATDASTGNMFKVTISANATLSNPTNVTDGEKLVWMIRQPSSGGPYTFALGTHFRFGTSFPSITLSTAANAVDYLGCIVNGDDTTIDIVSFARGY